MVKNCSFLLLYCERFMTEEVELEGVSLQRRCVKRVCIYLEEFVAKNGENIDIV